MTHRRAARTGPLDINDLHRRRELDDDPEEGLERVTLAGRGRKRPPARPAWPEDAVHPSFLRLAEIYAARTESPIELAALPMLASIAFALGPRWRVRAESMAEAPRVWFGIVAPPGTAKSPTAKPIYWPIVDLERQLNKDYEDAVADWESRKDRAHKAKPRREFREPRPAPDSAIVTDGTMEALIADLATASRGILWRSDELMQLLHSLDGYGQTGNEAGRGRMLSLWSGELIKVTRKNSPRIFIPSPCLSIIGGATPYGMKSLKLNKDDGLASRFLWSAPIPQSGGLGRRLPPAAIEYWQQIFRVAWEMPEREPEFEGAAIKLVDGLVRGWRDKAMDLGSRGKPCLIAGVYAKAFSQWSRLASLLHGIDVALQQLEGGPVPRPDEDLVERAAELVRYHIAHAQYCLRLVSGDEEAADAGEGPSHEDLRILDGLRGLAPFEDTRTAAGWTEVLAQQGLEINDRKLGRTLARLASEELMGITIERQTRTKKGRLWHIAIRAIG